MSISLLWFKRSDFCMVRERTVDPYSEVGRNEFRLGERTGMRLGSRFIYFQSVDEAGALASLVACLAGMFSEYKHFAVSHSYGRSSHV